MLGYLYITEWFYNAYKLYTFEAKEKMNNINSLIQNLKNKNSFHFQQQCILGANDPLSTTNTIEEIKRTSC